MRSWLQRRWARGGSGLPQLQTWWPMVYNVVWGAVLLAALAMSGINVWKGLSPAEYGWLNYGLSGSANGRQIFMVVGEEAAAKGVEAGDTVLAIDGVPTAQIGMSYAEQLSRLVKPEGSRVALTLRDARGEVETVSLTSSAANTKPHRQMRTLETLATLFMQILLIAGAIVLFRRRRDAVPAMLAISFPLLAATAGGEAMLWLDFWLAEQALLLGGFGLLLLGLLTFPSGRLSTRASRMLALAIVAWSILLFVLPAMVSPVVFLVGLAALLLAVAARQILVFRGMPPGNERQQVRWATFGFVCGVFFFAAGLAITAVAGQMGTEAYFQLSFVSLFLAPLGIASIVGGLLVSLMRYRLYDADAVIGRSATYGILTLGFVALFAGSEKVIEALGKSFFGGEGGAVAGGLAAAVAAALIVPLHRWVNDWAERRFQKELLRLRRGLPELVGDLRETASVNRISGAVAAAAASGVQATRAAVLIDDTVSATHDVPPEEARQWLAGRDLVGDRHEDRQDPFFPFRLPLQTDTTGRVGWLVLGPRPDGSLYGKDERQALFEIAGPVARAIEIARMRELRDGELTRLLDRIEERISGLELLKGKFTDRLDTAVPAT